MKCYYHHDRDAFGICKNCGKGLCLECMDDSDTEAIVCKNKKCADKVKLMKILDITCFVVIIALLIMAIADMF